MTRMRRCRHKFSPIFGVERWAVTQFVCLSEFSGLDQPIPISWIGDSSRLPICCLVLRETQPQTSEYKRADFQRTSYTLRLFEISKTPSNQDKQCIRSRWYSDSISRSNFRQIQTRPKRTPPLHRLSQHQQWLRVIKMLLRASSRASVFGLWPSLLSSPASSSTAKFNSFIGTTEFANFAP